MGSSATRRFIGHVIQPIFFRQIRLTAGKLISELHLIFIVVPGKFYSDILKHWCFFIVLWYEN